METTISPQIDFIIDEEFPCVQGIYLQPTDRYIFWIGGCLTFLATSFLIIGSLRFKELRRQPGDLIVGIAFSDLILSIHWLILASFPTHVQYSGFCIPVGALGTFGGINEFLYNSCFSIFLIISLRNALKQAKIPSRSFHIFNLTVSVIYLIDLLLKSEIGRTLAGTCSIRSKCEISFYNYVGALIVLVYATLGAFTYYYVRKNMPKCAKASAKRAQFLNYYLRYNVAASIIYVFIAVMNILDTVESNSSSFYWANSIYNVAKLCSPLVLTFIRYNDPTIKSFMMRTIFFWRSSKKTEQNAPFIKNADNTGISKPNPGDADDSVISNKDFIFNELSSNLKVGLTYTLLSCILYASGLSDQRRGSVTEQTAARRSKNPYKQEKVFLIEESSIFTDVPGVQEEVTKQEQNILSGTLKVYAPEVFGEFVNQDKDFLNIASSLDFVINREQIMAASGADGGKSGEFFFFSRDKKLILKTVPAEELNMMFSILERYDDHFKEYPDSLIAKMYGIYTYENSDLGLKFNLVLLKNVCGFSSKFVHRVYDMKGSRYERETLKENEELPETEMRKKVFKDLDFERFEKKLNIKPEFKQAFLKQITADSNFFRANNLIDYSFMVFFVNKEEAYKEVDIDSDFTARNSLASIENANQPGMYYNMGIIDYLQPYTFRKALERFIKRVKKLDRNLETSSQDPDYYSIRFIRFMEKIVNQE